MKFKIPYTVAEIGILKMKAGAYTKRIKKKEKTSLQSYLEGAGVDIDREEYLGICYRTFTRVASIVLIFSMIFFFLLGMSFFYLYSLGLTFLISMSVFFSQVNYPRMFALKKSRDIEKNLVSALQDMLVQLNSGVPLFQIMTNISNSGYGYVSKEFSRAVAQINSGTPQIDAVESLIRRNTSTYFKRVLWQISNGMRAGSNMSIVIEDSIDNLTKEQAIQIQNYGSSLNPLIVFYMMVTVILPSLGLTFFCYCSLNVRIFSWRN